jgi:hypothetical protein
VSNSRAVYWNGFVSEPDEFVVFPNESNVYVWARAPAGLVSEVTEPTPSAS